MPEQLEGRARELLEGANFCHVVTLGKSGRPLINPVWVDAGDGDVLLNSAEGRQWPANVRRDPQIALCVTNHENPYEYVTIWGRVVEDTHEGADEHINQLSQKYLGQDEYPFRQPGEQRIKFRVEPERIKLYGAS